MGNQPAIYACADVHYRGNRAKAACLTFNAWQSENPVSQYTGIIEHIDKYVPGQFYKRELPCLLQVLGEVRETLEVLVIDGYVWLDADKTPGLGAYLYQALDQLISIIGVAKSRFRGSAHAVEVYRGRSKNPLLITSVGIPPAEAAMCIRDMHGKYRIPRLLKLTDQLGRQNFC